MIDASNLEIYQRHQSTLFFSSFTLSVVTFLQCKAGLDKCWTADAVCLWLTYGLSAVELKVLCLHNGDLLTDESHEFLCIKQYFCVTSLFGL